MSPYSANHTIELGYFREQIEQDISFGIEILEADIVIIAYLVRLDKPVQWVVCAVAWLLLLIGTYFRYILYSFLFDSYKAKENKPIDKLILVITLVQHINILSFLIRLTLMFSNDGIVGAKWYCAISSLFFQFDLYYSYIGSLGISVFRILYIKYNGWLKYNFGENKLLYIILFGGLSLAAIFLAMLNVHDFTQIQFEYCLQASQLLVVEKWIDEYEQSRGNVTTLQITTTLTRIVLFSLVVMALAEITLYCVYFHHIYRHDNNERLKRLLEPAAIRKRNRQNAVTFFGQFCSFVLDFGLSIITILAAANFDVGRPFWVLFYISKIANFTAICIVEVLTSRSLRTRINFPFRRSIYKIYIKIKATKRNN